MEIRYVVLGWLLGTLSPGIVEAIKRPKRRKELFAAIATELRELRYKLAMIANRMRGRSGTLTVETLQLVQPILLGYKGTSKDVEFQANFSKVLEIGEAQYIAMSNAQKGKGSPYPVPYQLPFLDAHLHELGLFSPSVQERLLRMRAEFHLFNEQVQQTRTFHDRSFKTTEQNHALNASNYEASLERLAYRSEALINEINAVLADE